MSQYFFLNPFHIVSNIKGYFWGALHADRNTNTEHTHTYVNCPPPLTHINCHKVQGKTAKDMRIKCTAITKTGNRYKHHILYSYPLEEKGYGSEEGNILIFGIYLGLFCIYSIFHESKAHTKHSLNYIKDSIQKHKF